jgi:hypothetical protein
VYFDDNCICFSNFSLTKKYEWYVSDNVFEKLHTIFILTILNNFAKNKSLSRNLESNTSKKICFIRLVFRFLENYLNNALVFLRLVYGHLHNKKM